MMFASFPLGRKSLSTSNREENEKKKMRIRKIAASQLGSQSAIVSLGGQHKLYFNLIETYFLPHQTTAPRSKIHSDATWIPSLSLLCWSAGVDGNTSVAFQFYVSSRGLGMHWEWQSWQRNLEWMTTGKRDVFALRSLCHEKWRRSGTNRWKTGVFFWCFCHDCLN
ncbi:AAEL005623-PA [Aedes aegypti]|uniref:AAEL005623-PA n=1 Tax=Aedes aegypti TaxID=7159 RepID=Q179H2_AEDAE|nr:AAEL005623-PA [Aedes aegypti]